ncbi:class I adenylate-forming enzyme family protein [Ilumatobacter sp.]|uniref:class I adenylate-forming enzyme family protein n=1 Tax=Ilumatobacter sp. TaxID=1967498 RepID=UPI003751EE6B
MTDNTNNTDNTAFVSPFDSSGVVRTADGVLRYPDLPRSLIDMFRTAVERNPNGEALVELGGDRVMFQQWWDRSSRVAGGLRTMGIAEGDRVAIHLINGNDWAYAFFGVLMAGAIVVPVNTRFSESEVQYVVTDSGAKYVFEDGVDLPDGEPHVAEIASSDALAGIFYTSGTTGFPKGAMTTHENFLSNCETCRRVIGMAEDVELRNLISVPMFHVTGCNSQLLLTLYLGGTTVIMPTFDVQSFLRAIVDENVNVIISVPAILWLAMNQDNFDEFDVSHVRYVTYGGAPMATEIINKLRANMPAARLGNGFGLTETSSVSTFLPDEYADERPETVGFAAPVVELRLDDPDPDSGVGELLIRGQNVVAGYWNKPEQTAETFVDGWLRTGDLARIDHHGFVQIVDRMKDMVNRGGENVYSVEVENAIATHPEVFEVAVIGVPDTMMGEKVGAVVVAQPNTDPDPAAICQWVRDQIADFKVPQFITFREEPLPRNAGGKVLKARLREETTWGDQLR